MISQLLLRASESPRLERTATRSRLTRAVVDRYVAGVRLEDAIRVARESADVGVDVSLDLLGESVTDLRQADRATDEYLLALKDIAEQAPSSTISVKLSQLGIGMSAIAGAANLGRLLTEASALGVQVEVDMEYSAVALATVESVREHLPTHPLTRMAIQASVRHSMSVLESFNEIKPRVRLVKGAFREPLAYATQDKQEITELYKSMSGWVLSHLPDPAFGTHDDACISFIQQEATRLGIERDQYEFQMLYGVRRERQRELARQGYRVRVYVPYGSQWYPYLMRRLAEKPSNLALFVRSLGGG